MSIQKLKDACKEENAIALVFSEENLLYFTGFATTNGVLLVSGDCALFFTDGRYIEAAQKKITDCDEVLLLESFEKSVLPKLPKNAELSVLLEGERLSYARAEKLKALLTQPVIMDRLDEIIKEIRKTKTMAQADAIIRAQRIAEKALEIIKPKIVIGAVERELALELDYTMLRLGAQAISFETILISGKNTSLPHGVPSTKRIERGDLVTIDFGAVFDSYHSDMTRTFAIGEISDKQRIVYDTVLKAQTVAIHTIKPAKSGKEIDAVAREVIGKAGFGAYFTHSLGHGVGVEIHEYPVLSPKSEETLQVGNVVTVEPGIYLPGAFGVRIEDMGMVTDNGYLNFTKTDKALEVL